MSAPVPVTVALCGLGGYGESYLAPLLEEGERRGFRFVGGIDPAPERCGRLTELAARGIPVFPSMDDFYRDRRCDLMIVCSPIHLHCRHTCLALERGSHVLCEKPLCAVPEEARRMEAAEKAAGRTVSIGYQWSYSVAVQAAKADFLAGRFGAPRRLRTLVCWPRGRAYYARSRWAGARRAPGGEWVFDSPVNNAAAHFLHNMLYLAGPGPGRSAMPERIEAELGRANPIGNYDTAALRIGWAGGPELLFYATHASRALWGPVFSYEFEEAVLSYDWREGRIAAAFRDGTAFDYGSPNSEPHAKLWSALRSARDGTPSLCGIAAASAHTRCVALAQQAPGGIVPFPPGRIGVAGPDDNPWNYVEGLQETLACCYAEGTLPSEAAARPAPGRKPLLVSR